jgi:hypothetical protein
LGIIESLRLSDISTGLPCLDLNQGLPKARFYDNGKYAADHFMFLRSDQSKYFEEKYEARLFFYNPQKGSSDWTWSTETSKVVSFSTAGA